jgi:hypothetical protein
VDWIQVAQDKDQWQTVMKVALSVDSNTLLGLLVPEDTGSTRRLNFGIGVFTKLQCVTSEKRPKAIKVYICHAGDKQMLQDQTFSTPFIKACH